MFDNQTPRAASDAVIREIEEPKKRRDPCGIPEFDSVTKPKHYMLFSEEKQVIDLIRDRCEVMYTHVDSLSVSSGYEYGNAIKYLMRWPLKNGVEDLRKCRQYLDMMIEELSE